MSLSESVLIIWEFFSLNSVWKEKKVVLAASYANLD